MPLTLKDEANIQEWAVNKIQALSAAILDEKIWEQIQLDLDEAIKKDSLNLSAYAKEEKNKKEILALLKKEVEKHYPCPDELLLSLPEKNPLFAIVSSKEKSKKEDIFAIRSKTKTNKTALEALRMLFDSPPSDNYLVELGITVSKKRAKPDVEKFTITNNSQISYKVFAIEQNDTLSYQCNLKNSEKEQQEAIDRICRIAVHAAPKNHTYDLSHTPDEKKIMVLSGLTRALRDKNPNIGEDEIERLIPESIKYRHLRPSR